MDKDTCTTTSEEMADQHAKEAARNKNTEECYIIIPRNVVTSEQKRQRDKWW